jgi:hypothetical protein
VGSDWLTATLSGTSAPATLTLQPNTTSLAAGTYTATVTVASSVPGVGSATVGVTLVVRQPQIALGSTTVALGDRTRGAAITSSSISVANGGQGTLSGLAAASSQSWVTPSLGSTTAPTTLTLAYNTAGLTAGSYTATVTVSSTVPGVTSQAVSVTVNVQQPQIALSGTPVTRSVNVGTNASGATIGVSNGGTGSLTGLAVGSPTYSAGASGWVSASINTSTAPATVTLTLNTSGIASAGTFTATIPVSSTVPGVTTQNITVTATTRWEFTTHILPLFNASCNGCHTFTSRASVVGAAPTLSPCAGTGRTRVIANDTTNSLLYRKLSMTTPPCGSRMPSSTGWDATSIAKVREWILDGAP